MMGRQSNDPTVLHSSIALLQERFRQLQRVKEMREERELLRGIAMAGSDPMLLPQHPKWFSHPDLVRPSRPLSGPPAQWGERPESRALETSLSRGFSMQSSNIRSETDVDTSLHLLFFALASNISTKGPQELLQEIIPHAPAQTTQNGGSISCSRCGSFKDTSTKKFMQTSSIFHWKHFLFG